MSNISSVSVRSLLNMNVSSTELSTVTRFNNSIKSIEPVKSADRCPDRKEIMSILSHMKQYIEKKEKVNNGTSENTKLANVSREYKEARVNLRNDAIQSKYTEPALTRLLGLFSVAMLVKPNEKSGMMTDMVLRGLMHQHSTQIKAKVNDAIKELGLYKGKDEVTNALFGKFLNDIDSIKDNVKEMKPSTEKEKRAAIQVYLRGN